MSEDFHAVAALFPDPFRLLVRDRVGSTNDDLQQLARDGAEHGLVLLAHDQQQGRGRRGAQWLAPPGETLAFSILVRPTEAKPHWPRLALATGLAVAEALEEFGVQPGIKWPNDLWIDGRKVAGILVEAGEDFVIVGIGINVHSTAFAPEIADIATSLRLALGSSPGRDQVLEAVVRRVALRHGRIGADFPQLIDSVKERCVLTGSTVVLTTPSGPKGGVVEGISPTGALLLNSGNGTEALIQADEVRIVS